MFAPEDGARIFGIAPGVDFPRSVAEGVLDRMRGAPPEALGRVRILVNTRRMQRRLRRVFAELGPGLLPRIGLVTEIDRLAFDLDLPPQTPVLERRLEIAGLVGALLDADPSLAPRSALFDLTDSLIALLDEMQGEGVDPEVVTRLSTGDETGHWQRSVRFLSVVSQYVAANGLVGADPEARQRFAAEALAEKWRGAPEKDPLIVAGSTASRGTTALFVKAVSALPQGAVILPGFDFETPAATWDAILSDDGHQDHPQYRFAALLNALGTSPEAIGSWAGEPPDRRRNRLISLSLRPAPVTDQWLSDGPGLGDLVAATEGIDLIEAPSQRHEAMAIAIAMRACVERQQTVALVTPDRTLGRRVAAALSRWGLVPDDSAGEPLSQTAPGRLVRMVARLHGTDVLSEDLIAVLRHPLARSDGSDRGQHLLMTQDLELFLRKAGVLHVSPTHLAGFAADNQKRSAWVGWISAVLNDLSASVAPRLGAQISAIVALAERIAAGPNITGSGTLWDRAAGRDTWAAIAPLMRDAEAGPDLTKDDAVRLLDRVLNEESTRISDESRSDLMIWGTLEARVQGADVVILGEVNEGVWPAAPRPDPWLNRRLRREAGLLLPERRIGLSAHDFQQAMSAGRVVISRALKDDETETVPSRWLNRLLNLISGLPDQGGEAAIKAMRARGHRFVSAAAALDRPGSAAESATRPAPAPPLTLRPKVLSVTEIETLIRDPYAIYAKHVLGLRALDPLRPVPDAAMRGITFHEILERLMRESPFADSAALGARFRQIADDVLAETVPWAGVRALWRGHLDVVSAAFAAEEMERQAEGRLIARETWGECALSGDAVGIKGKADRIDRLLDGRLAIYDYKSGAPPSKRAIRFFKRQLPIEAVMAEAGAFRDVPSGEVAFVSHIGLNRNASSDRYTMDDSGEIDLKTVTIKAELLELLSSYGAPDKGYPSRRAMEKVRWEGDFDHLARFGEWADTDPAEVVVLE